jgi:cell division protein FtsW (lipid II flippase)
MLLAGLFVALLTVTLSVSPMVRERSLLAEPRLSHWLGLAAWVSVYVLIFRFMRRQRWEGDALLLPLTGLLTGWGLLTIWRLTTTFGLRQSLWLVVSGAVFIGLIHFERLFTVLRQYKYVLLFGGLLLTALTILFGTNPLGIGPQLWLGCCGVYLQPSEPLKLLLIIYLASYLADRQPFATSFFSLVVPTIVVIGITTAILLVQRDLGTATVFLFIYTIVIYVATGNRSFLVIGTISLIAAGLFGTLIFDLVRLRVDAWLNPWLDPSGRSYQIVQSLIAIAAGGAFGRGIGIGSPGLVPVPHSDFIFSSIAEEHGVVGGLGLLVVIALVLVRGLLISIHAQSRFHRYLAVGLTTYLIGQSLLIIGGNIRLLPLTGVTLPFLSYGGSSLVSSFIALALLYRISGAPAPAPLSNTDNHPILLVGAMLLSGLLAAGLVAGWWGFVRGPDLQTRTDNARRTIADRFVLRGSLLDINGTPIHVSVGSPGNYQRSYLEGGTGNLYGYTHPIYGQSGAEQGFDEILRGEDDQPALLIWFNHLIYGQPPPGLDILSSIDIERQQLAQSLLGDTAGAVVALDVESGNLEVLASSPNYDPEQLDMDWTALIEDTRAPLINRTTQGVYPPGEMILPFLIAQAEQLGLSIESPDDLAFHLAEQSALLPLLHQMFDPLPAINLPLSSGEIPTSIATPQNLVNGRAAFTVSPLQLALAYGSLINEGAMPNPVFGISYQNADGEWIELPRPEANEPLFTPEAVSTVLRAYTLDDQEHWGMHTVIQGEERAITWQVYGDLPGDHDSFIYLVLLETDDLPLAHLIIQRLQQP